MFSVNGLWLEISMTKEPMKLWFCDCLCCCCGHSLLWMVMVALCVVVCHYGLLLSCVPVALFLLARAPVSSLAFVASFLLLCLIQEKSHVNAITMTPSLQQAQFHNQPAMNDDEDAIKTRRTTRRTTL